MTALDEFAARYVAVWNEADAAARDAAVAELWSADARVCTRANEYVGRVVRGTPGQHDLEPFRSGRDRRHLGPVISEVAG
jgi:hypothetical protein